MKGKMFYWLLIGCLIATGAGAAVGVVLSGMIEGKISVAVGQAIQIGPVTVTEEDGITPWPHPSFTSVSDDGTKFSAGVEAYGGEKFLINLSLTNQGNTDLFAECTILGATAEIGVFVEGSGVINDVVRISPGTWKFTLDSTAANGAPPVFDGLKVKVKVDKQAPPGFYQLTGEIKIVEY